MDTSAVAARFADMYGGEPAFVVRAPGRVNLIGEHTDYNDGFVFPAAIDFDVVVAGSPRPDGQVRLYSDTFGESATFSLDAIARTDETPWSNYPRGVAQVLGQEGHALVGMNAVVAGNVPLGSGLSSSAAIEVASCLAYEAAGGFTIEPVQRALLCQRAEREFVGVQCGIMDQFISTLGREAHALFIDTRTLEYRPVPIPREGVSLLIANTNKPRGLVQSAYNERRAECEEAVRALREVLPEVMALRDVSADDLAEHSGRLSEVVRKRARHVVTENARVLDSVRALEAGDVARFGRLMNESHASLRDDYQVSCRELDVLVEAAQAQNGVYGSRMTGAGFGGCTVSLARTEAVESVRRAVAPVYRAETGLETTFYVCRASEGASRVA
ncbi:MAG: galactokinase [Chthonomonadales bacterium]|nr:galactokinase [Chthonomonadales bacterium]